MCALAPVALAVTLAATPAPMCPRADTLAPVMAALVGDARIEPAATDPQFEAQIRAIRQAPPKTARRRHRA
ncbi:hypothetical protein MKK68_01950 [Methylobacterium sp. E-016]|uniref:hypothetical protein n=1 Tax=Methylobacterium sp. E-016 TaxID=2836556 RepID=UPI001FB90B62|nr:hypothetical protein [Methylobacterium sp. E-016]MCJ2074425.1 hypothetical protein [Methylobacterium sp. E-016]